jgi:hypothetical protein
MIVKLDYSKNESVSVMNERFILSMNAWKDVKHWQRQLMLVIDRIRETRGLKNPVIRVGMSNQDFVNNKATIVLDYTNSDKL